LEQLVAEPVKLIVATGALNTLIEIGFDVAEQPLGLVIATVYVPELLTVILGDVAPFDHR
jgi:hypothetical protein